MKYSKKYIKLLEKVINDSKKKVNHIYYEYQSSNFDLLRSDPFIETLFYLDILLNDINSCIDEFQKIEKS